MTNKQTIDGVSRETIQRIADHCKFWVDHPYLEAIADVEVEMRALLDKPAPSSAAIGHIEQSRSMGLSIGAPITNVIWDIPHPELKHLPNGAKVYLHSTAHPQGEVEPLAILLRQTQIKHSKERDTMRAQLAERDALLNRWLDMFDGGISSSMLGVLRESTRSTLSATKEGKGDE